MNDIPQIVDQTLTVLGQRFGATGEFLWHVLIRQAYVEFCVSVVAFVLLGTAMLSIRQAFVEGWRDADRFFAPVVGCLLLIMWAVSGIFVIVSLPGVLNPEYFALQQILKALP